MSSQAALRARQTDIATATSSGPRAKLSESPALVGSLVNGANAGSNSQNYGDASGANNVGTSVLDLRNLGSQRTLVLIDGRRQVNAYSGQNSVDINTIPVDLIEGIDLLTGGVSAIYGADGVTGVVNFRLKHEFQGLLAHVQTGISEKGDGNNRFVSLVAGENFGQGRGNITIAYEYNGSDRLNQHARDCLGDRYANLQLLRNIDNVSWQDSAPNGAVDIGLRDPVTGVTSFQFVPNFDGEGKPYDRGIPIPGSGGRAYNSGARTGSRSPATMARRSASPSPSTAAIGKPWAVSRRPPGSAPRMSATSWC